MGEGARAPPRRRFGWPSALLPLAAAVAAVPVVSALAFTERTFIGTVLENHFFGFFLRAYPLFLFAVVYGAARILVAGFLEPGGRFAWRVVAVPLALAVFLAACLYPTFGGIVLRPGYMAGGMAFLRGQSAPVASLLGAGAAALAFGALLGFCVLLARARLGFDRRRIGRPVLRFAALWLGGAILLAPAWFGLDLTRPWPAGPLGAGAAAGAGIAVFLALLPHALLSGLLSARDKDEQGTLFGDNR